MAKREVSRPPRYVVLRHVGHGEPHFDLMLERGEGGPLRTFRVQKWPVVGRQALTPLADHRRAYLEYEGEVSGGRGSVRRIETGTYRALRAPSERWHGLALRPGRSQGEDCAKGGCRKLLRLLDEGEAGWFVDLIERARPTSEFRC